MVFFAALRLLAAAVLVSPSPSPSPSASPLPQIVHVTTSDRSDETLHNAVRTTYVVTAADIAQNGYRTVAQALQNVPGVEIESYGPIGAQANYGIRGNAADSVLVLIDGEPAPGGSEGTVQLANITTAGVDRIEVVEGGGSTLYGQGSVGGIINVITNTQKNSPSAMLSWGSFDDRELQLSDYGFSFDRTVASNTFGVPAFSFPLTGGGSVTPDTNNNDYLATTGRFGYTHPIGALALTAHLSAETDDLGVWGGESGFYSPTSREHDVNNTATVSLALPRAQSTATLALNGSMQQTTLFCNTGGIDPNCTQTSPYIGTDGQVGLNLRDVVHGASERTIYGVDLSRSSGLVNDGYGDPVATSALSQSAAYVQQTWFAQSYELYAGVRGERDGSQGGEYSPSLGFRYDLSGSLNLKVNAATAFRAPTWTDLYYPDYGNPDLHAERSQLGDATLTDNAILGGVAVSWFDQTSRDLIVYDPTTFAPANIDHAHIAGLTLDGKTPPLNNISMTFNATNLYLAQDLDTGERLNDDPVLAVNLGVVYTGSPRSFLNEIGISERIVGQRGFVDYSQPTFYQPIPYDDLTAYATFRITRKLLLSARGFNLGNERYAEVAGYPMPGRSLRVELRTSAGER